MGRKNDKRLARQQRKKQKQMWIGIAASVLTIAIIVVLVIVLQPRATTVDTLSIAPEPNGDLRISKNSLQNQLNYINYGGTEELIVWEDGDGIIRTAFDTCEECYANGSVHFTLSNETLTCNLCGTTQEVSNLGIESWGGCMPVSVPPDMRHDTDTEVVLSAELLSYAEHMFGHWDTSDFGVSLAAYGTDEVHSHE